MTMTADQLLVAQTIAKCVRACRQHRYIGDKWPADNTPVEQTFQARFGWTCREKELQDFALAMSKAFAETDRTFDASAFMNIALVGLLPK